MHLYKHLRIHQIFGANTDVGKTVLGTALVLSSAERGRFVRYLKPVSTGPLQDADDAFVKRFSHRYKDTVQRDCLFQFQEPVSPHLALRLQHGQGFSKNKIPTDRAVLKSIAKYIDGAQNSPSKSNVLYIETAGGVHSPSISGISQVDSYRSLRLPTILVGDSKLGGISSTISSYESLIVRGYSVDSILLFREDYYRNWDYLTAYFNERGVHVASFPAPPPKSNNTEQNFVTTDSYFSELLKDELLSAVDEHLDNKHSERIEELHSMPSRTLDSIWWPFVQHGHVKEPKDVTVIDSAFGDFFSVYTGHTNSDSSSNLLSSSYDGSASWWTQAFGHGQPSLALAAARAAGRYGHVMFPAATHLPALRLAERLLSPKGPGNGWASRVFYSDDGSTAMEVALKMALRAYCKRHGSDLDQTQKQRLGILGLKGSYHGDTIGAMDACYDGDGVYTCEWHSAKGFWLDPPTIGLRDGKAYVDLPDSIVSAGNINEKAIEAESLQWLYNVPQRLDTELATQYRRFISETLHKLAQSVQSPRLAALVLEPLVMGAGGMIFVDPLFQRILVDVVRESSPERGPDGSWQGLPVIFDEVFTGLYRLGQKTCISTLGVTPDIAVYAKTLTGGVVPLAVTLASESIFNAFLGDNKAEALLHGHSYTAHAVGCEVACESLDLMEKLETSNVWTEVQRRWGKAVDSASTQSAQSSSTVWSMWNPKFVKELSKLPVVESVMTMGTVLAVKLRGTSEGYRSQLAQTALQSIKSPAHNESDSFGVHFRTLGDVAYFMTSLNSSQVVIREVERRIMNALQGGEAYSQVNVQRKTSPRKDKRKLAAA
ncbi:PLP-dependent transferase [Fomitiporia mediterranea MF3/22]|uniref:PLP-dependent transferase n=1 Tax=Fomitiporia mediterranea (strain MF3/22) TaxID=694068 RepID=UPI00044074EC|nr:PLP-dependent transferase [Fomitiporia mediterranea MF3/22]EJD06670.1 PLP-dependent transferase [Fomitiporia mediterranea MF3/22]